MLYGTLNVLLKHNITLNEKRFVKLCVSAQIFEEAKIHKTYTYTWTFYIYLNTNICTYTYVFTHGDMSMHMHIVFILHT